MSGAWGDTTRSPSNNFYRYNPYYFDELMKREYNPLNIRKINTHQKDIINKSLMKRLLLSKREIIMNIHGFSFGQQ